jgi:hypothetical protein
MVLCICTTTKYNSRLSHNISHSKIKSRQVHFTMPLIFPSRNAQDTVRPYETNPSLRPMLRTGASEELINMNLHQTYVDNYFDILQANATTPLLGPYTTPWIPGALTLWSKSLIEHGKFESADAALLAFTVDCAMKVYITADLDLPCLELRGDDDIVWTLIFEAYWAAVRNQQRHAGRQGASISAVDNFLIFAVECFPKIRQRCQITFRQKIQDPAIRDAFASELVGRAHRRFSGMQPLLKRTYMWVYGKTPSRVVEERNDRREGEQARPLISIRQWVFEQN